MIYHFGYENDKFGSYSVVEEDEFIIGLYFSDVSLEGEEKETDIIKEAHRQIEAYFLGKLREFSLRLKLHGTDFHKSVWRELQQIPYGETMSYALLAERVGNVNACRAVANACHFNRIPVIVPCHRIICSNGTLGGYALGVDFKNKLLSLER